MAIYRRGKLWWIDYSCKGRRIRESVSESRQEAVKALQARKGDIVRGEFRVRGKERAVFFGEFAAEFAGHLKLTRRGWTKEVSRLRTLVRHFGKRLLSGLTPYDVERYREARRTEVAGPSVNRELALLKSLYGKAARWGFSVIENPVKGVPYFPERQRERILGEDEARRLVTACGGSIRPVVVVALNTGMRLSEILGHSDIAMTVLYSHPSDTRKMEAVERLAAREKPCPDAALSDEGGHNLVTIPVLAPKGPCVTH